MLFSYRHSVLAAAWTCTAVITGLASAAEIAPRLAADVRLSPPRLGAPPSIKPAPPGDPQPVDWRTANSEVERMGGHAGYLRASVPEGTRGDPPGGSPAGAPQ